MERYLNETFTSSFSWLLSFCTNVMPLDSTIRIWVTYWAEQLCCKTYPSLYSMDVWNMLITPQKPKVKLSWQSSREAGSRILLLSNNLYRKDFRKSKSFEENPIAGPTQPRSLLFTPYAISQSAKMKNHRGPRIAHMKWKTSTIVKPKKSRGSLMAMEYTHIPSEQVQWV